MAISPENGIMALPENQGMNAPQLSLMDSYEAMRTGLETARPDAAQEMDEALAGIRDELASVTDAELEQLIQAVKEIYDNPEQYEATVAELIAQDALDEGDFPPQYDEEFISAVLMALVDAQRSRSGMNAAAMPGMDMAGMQGMMPPTQFARGGIADAARIVAAQGRNGDTMLAHITPSEARLLHSRGGSGTINPATGLPEFFLGGVFKAIGKAFKGVTKFVKNVFKSPIGRIVGTIALGFALGPMVGALMKGYSATTIAATTAAAASGTASALGGGNIKDILTSAATGFIGAPGGPVSGYIGKYTGQYLANETVRSAANAAITGTAAGLVTGKGLKQSIVSGLTEGAIAGGIAALSGAPKVDVDNVAKTSAANATSTAAAVADAADANAARIMAAPKPAGIAALPSPVDVPAGGLPANANAVGIMTANPSAGLTPEFKPLAGVDYQLAEGIDTPYRGGTQAGMQTASASPAGELYKPGGPSIRESAGDMYSGAKKVMQGDFSAGADQFATGAENLLMPGPSKQQVMDYAKANNMTYDAAEKFISPSTLRTYGPAVAAGGAALVASGAFKQTPPQETEEQKAMRAPIDLSGNPNKYYIQGLSGVQYDSRGAITGSSVYNAPQTMQDVNVPTQSYTGYAPTYAQQSYTPPRNLNMGGIAALREGGYPRRTGQISGPGTEKSDSIPAMLSDGEFVMTAKAVRGAGGGSRLEGAKRMYALMHQLERNAARG